MMPRRAGRLTGKPAPTRSASQNPEIPPVEDRRHSGFWTHTNAHRRGIVLTELMMVLLLAAFVLAATAWGMNAQLSIQRALMEQADRHAVMRAILTQLRRDLADASAVVPIAERVHVPTTMPTTMRPRKNVPAWLGPLAWIVPEMATVQEVVHVQPTDLEADYVEASMSVERPEGAVHYRLYHRGPRYWQPVNSTRPPPPPEQILVRTDAAGEERRWSLHGATLSLTVGEAGTGETPVPEARLLRVRFDFRTQYATGHDKRHKFDTTLLAGGVP